MSVPEVSVVVCTLNEENRLEDCLRSIIANEPGELIVVDGGSKDRTVEIAQRYADKLVQTSKSSLTKDRQTGIDAANKKFIAMIDSDHRLEKGDIQSLLDDMHKFSLDIVQSQLISYKNLNFWNRAEEQAWDITHNIPGPKKMIGVAPAIFKKELFERIRFDDTITKTIDDTDFMYRLSKIPEFTFGIGETKVKQLHFGSFHNYTKKFLWYGYGDGEFCFKHPNRAFSMFFHLVVRYQIIYSCRALFRGRIGAIPYFLLQGNVRFYGMIKKLLLLLGSKTKQPPLTP